MAPTQPKPSGSGGLNDLLIGLKSSSTASTTVSSSVKPVVVTSPSTKATIVTPVPIPAKPVTPAKSNPCLNNPCKNNGQCVVDATSSFGFKCVCATLFTGELCEDMNHCFSNPCKNGGSCHNLRVKYYCSCSKNYQGDNCEKGE
jgi:hypothetical protein